MPRDRIAIPRLRALGEQPRPTTFVGYKSEQIEFVGDVVSPVEVEWEPAAPQKRRSARTRRRS